MSTPAQRGTSLPPVHHTPESAGGSPARRSQSRRSPRRTRSAATVPRYTSLRSGLTESEKELSGELWVVSGRNGVQNKKAWVVVNQEDRRLSIYSSYSRDHAKLIDDVDFRLLMKLFWFIHDSPPPSESRNAKAVRYWYFGLELMKEPGGKERVTAAEGTMRDRRSEVIIFGTDVKEEFRHWDAFLSGNVVGSVVVRTREEMRAQEMKEAEDKLVELTAKFESDLAEANRQHAVALRATEETYTEKLTSVEAQYAQRLEEVVTRSDYEKHVQTFLEQKKAYQAREREFQEGLHLAQKTIADLEKERAELESMVQQQEARVAKETEVSTVLRREVEERVLELSEVMKDRDSLAAQLESLGKGDQGVHELLAQVSLLEKEREELEGRVEAAEKERDELRVQGEGARTQSQRIEEELEQLRADKDGLLSELSQQQQVIENMHSQLLAAGEAVEAYTAQYEKLQEELTEKRAELDQLRQTLLAELGLIDEGLARHLSGDTECTVQNLVEIVMSMTREKVAKIEEALRSAEGADADRDTLSAKVETLERALRTEQEGRKEGGRLLDEEKLLSADRIASLEDEVASLRKALDEMTDQHRLRTEKLLGEASEERTELMNRIDQLLRDIGREQDASKASKADAIAAREAEAARTAELVAAKEELLKRSSELADAESRLAVVEAEADRLRAQQSETQKIEGTFEDQQRRADELSARYEQLTAKYASTSAMLTAERNGREEWERRAKLAEEREQENFDKIADLEEVMSRLVATEGRKRRSSAEQSQQLSDILDRLQEQADEYRNMFHVQQERALQKERELELLMKETELVLESLQCDHDLDMGRLGYLSENVLAQLRGLSAKHKADAEALAEQNERLAQAESAVGVLQQRLRKVEVERVVTEEENERLSVELSHQVGVLAHVRKFVTSLEAEVVLMRTYLDRIVQESVARKDSEIAEMKLQLDRSERERMAVLSELDHLRELARSSEQTVKALRDELLQQQHDFERAMSALQGPRFKELENRMASQEEAASQRFEAEQQSQRRARRLEDIIAMNQAEKAAQGQELMRLRTEVELERRRADDLESRLLQREEAFRQQLATVEGDLLRQMDLERRRNTETLDSERKHFERELHRCEARLAAYESASQHNDDELLRLKAEAASARKAALQSDEEVGRLRDELQRSNEKCARSQQELDEARNAVQQLESKMASARRDHGEAIAALEGSLRSGEAEKKQMMHLLEEARGEAARHLADLETASTATLELEKAVAKKDTELKKLEGVLKNETSLKDEVLRLQSKLDITAKAKGELEARFDEATAEHHAEVQGLRAQVKQLSETEERLHSDIEKANEALEKERSTVAALRASAKESSEAVHQTIDEKDAELQRLRAAMHEEKQAAEVVSRADKRQITELQEAHKDLEEAKGRLQRKVEEGKREMEQLQDELAASRAETQQVRRGLTADMGELHEQLAAKDGELRKVEGRVKQLEHELHEGRSELESLRQALADVGDAKEEAERQVHHLQEEGKQAAQRSKQLADDLAGRAAEVSRLQEIVDGKSTQHSEGLKAERESRAHVEKLLGECREQVAALEKELSSRDDEAKRVAHQHAGSMADLEAEVKAKGAELHRMENRLEQAAAEIDELETSLAKAKRERKREAEEKGALQDVADQLRGEVSRLEQRLRGEEAAHSESKEEVTKLRSDLAAAARSHSHVMIEFERERSQKEVELKKVESALQQAHNECAQLREGTEGKEGKVKQLMESLEAEKARAQQLEHDKEAALARAKSRDEALRVLQDEMVSSAAAHSKEVESLKAEVEEKSRALVESEEKVRRLAAEVHESAERLENEQREREEEAQRFSDEVKRLEGHLSESALVLEQAQDEARRKEEALKHLQERQDHDGKVLEKLEDQLGGVSRIVEEKELRIKAIMAENSELLQRVEQLEHEADRAGKEIDELRGTTDEKDKELRQAIAEMEKEKDALQKE
eukprot:Sspe_Gene.69555::Locus_41005_Transcript_1_1_Confidence_1.000_Length_6035::g.69555::m.69555